MIVYDADFGNNSLSKLESVPSNEVPVLIEHDYGAYAAYYYKNLFVSENFNDIPILDLSPAFTHSTIQHNNTTIILSLSMMTYLQMMSI